MKRILFDTDVLIDILRKNSKTISQLQNLANETDEFLCSTITVGEIFAGMFSREEKMTRKLLDGLSHIPVDSNLAELAGKLKFKTKSHKPWLDDCLIAATAILHECTLLTKNVKHYPFPELKLLKIN